MAKRMLLVEDEVALARAMTRLLRRAGYEVEVAETCTAARQASGSFSLGIFDINLPDGDGVLLAEELLSSGQVRRAVFFSGSLDAVERRRAQRFGPFVEKSMGFPALHATIELSLAGMQVKVVGSADTKAGNGSSVPPSGVRGNGKTEKPN